MANKFLIVFRKRAQKFNSIENVFGSLLTHLGCKRIELPYYSKGVLNRIKNVFFIKRIQSKYIHVTGHDHYLLLFPFKKTILTIHDVEALNRKSGFKRFIFKKLWFDWPIKNASVVTTISEFSKKEIQQIGNYSTDIKVIYNPLTLPLDNSPKIFNSEMPRILHLGMKGNKNLKRLIQAICNLKCKLIIIGSPNREIKSILEKNQVQYEFKTDISNNEVINEYKKCDIVAFVSTYEGFGLPIIEAQAAGRALITSNCSSMPEVAGDGALFVDPYSVESIQKGIEMLITNHKLRNDLILLGLENVKRFHPETIATQYSKLYAQLG